MNRWISVFIGLSCYLSRGSAFAEVGIEPSAKFGRSAVHTGIGFDNSVLTVGLGYAHGFGIERWDRNISLSADLAIPMLRPDFRDFRARVSGRVTTLRRDSFEVPAQLELHLRGTDNAAFRAIGIATNLMVTPGWYRPRWFVAAELAWDQQWATHLTHSHEYRELYFADVADGWYANTATTARFGARVGGLITPRIELMLRGGYQHGSEFVRAFASPFLFYAIVGASVRFIR